MTGYVRKRGATFRIEIHLGYTPEGKRLRYSETLSVSTRREADDLLRDKLRQLATEGTIRKRSVDTLQAYLERWLEVSAKPRVRQRTFEGYAELLKSNVFETALGRQPLASLTPLDIQAHYQGLQEAVLRKRKEREAKNKSTGNLQTGATLIKNLHAVLRSALNQAVKWRELQQNPALFVDRPRVQRREKVVLRPEEFSAFVGAALAEERCGALWVLELVTGCRPEEALALRWPDVNWRTCEVSFMRALVRPRKIQVGEPVWRFEPVKTDRGRRIVPLDEQVVFILRRHQAQQAEEKLRAGAEYEDHGLVFCNELGGPLHQHNLSQRVFPRIVERAGLNPELTPYSLRHSCATGMLELGEDIGQVSNMLGHASSHFTFDTYVARRPLRGAASKIGQAIFGSAPDAQRREVGRQ